MTRIRKQPDSADTLSDKQRGEANKYLYSDIRIYSLLRFLLFLPCLINFNPNLYSKVVLPTMMMLLHLDSFTQGFPALEII